MFKALYHFLEQSANYPSIILTQIEHQARELYHLITDLLATLNRLISKNMFIKFRRPYLSLTAVSPKYSSFRTLENGRFANCADLGACGLGIITTGISGHF